MPQSMAPVVALRDTLVTEPIRILVGGLREKAAGADSAAAKALSWRGLLPADGWGRGMLTAVVTALTIVLLLLLIALAVYAIYHLAHSFQHHHWKEPPRRTRKYAVGKDGISVEYVEEQAEAHKEVKEWTEKQFADLRRSLDIFWIEHDHMNEAVRALRTTSQRSYSRLQTSIAGLEERVVRMEREREVDDG